VEKTRNAIFIIYHIDKDHIRNEDGPLIPGNKEAREDLKMELSS
jgi:hypothetical protein